MHEQDDCQQQSPGASKRVVNVVAAMVAALLLMIGALTPGHAVGSVERGLKMASSTLGRPIVYSIYLPSRYADGGRRFPVVYLLHGHGDDENAWLRWGKLRRTLDRLIARRAVEPMIIVMAMAGNSWYVDDANETGYGPVAKAFTTDLISSVDQGYRTLPCREARAIGGVSMGGYGAVLFAITSPGKYAAAISFSGSLFSENLKFERSRHPLFTSLFGGVFGSPFDYNRYRRFNVFTQLRGGFRNTSPKPVMWLTAGNNDFPSIIRGTKKLHTILRDLGVESRLRIDKAHHEWPYWAKAIVPALKWLSPKLSSSCPKRS